MQDCCSLALYSREELDQIEWDLLFSLNHHLSIKLTFLYLYFTCTDWISQLLCVEVLKHHFSLTTLMVLTLFAHISIFLDFHIQILNLKRPPTFLDLRCCGCLDHSYSPSSAIHVQIRECWKKFKSQSLLSIEQENQVASQGLLKVCAASRIFKSVLSLEFLKRWLP